MSRYSFSGHETFTCKSLWLKKGYDFLKEGHRFVDDDAVIFLGVGKNMVSSIRFWLRAFGLTVADRPTRLANLLFDDAVGLDPFTENLNTLWLLHYQLVKSQVASLYNLMFLGVQRNTKIFTRDQVQTYVKRMCSVPEQKNVYNENTVKKDIGVFLSNYVMPSSTKSLEDFNALMIDLGMIRILDKKCVFGQTDPSRIAPEVILYALIDYSGEDKTISLNQLQDIALIFGLSLPDLIIILQQLASKYHDQLVYTDNAGVRNIQFCGERIDKESVIEKIYK